MPVIVATWEAKARGLQVQGQAWDSKRPYLRKSWGHLSSDTILARGPGFNPQCWKKKKLILWDFSNEVSHFGVSIFLLHKIRWRESDCQSYENSTMQKILSKSFLRKTGKGDSSALFPNGSGQICWHSSLNLSVEFGVVSVVLFVRISQKSSAGEWLGWKRKISTGSEINYSYYS
jgi:hypothetical protein